MPLRRELAAALQRPSPAWPSRFLLFGYNWLNSRIKNISAKSRVHRRIRYAVARAAQLRAAICQVPWNSGDKDVYDDINITPMLDLAYVLMVIFIIMTTASVQES